MKRQNLHGRKQKTIRLNTKIHLGYGFPYEPGTSRTQRLNDIRNNEKMTRKIMKPVLKALKPQIGLNL